VTPATPEHPDAAGARADRDFINNGSRFMLADNASKIVGPLLVLVCAKLYAGGEWGFFKYYESVLLLLTRLAVLGMDRGVVWIYAQRGGDDAFVRVFSRALNFVVLFAVFLALVAGAHWMGWLPSWTGLSQTAPGATGFNIACYLASIPFQAMTVMLLQSLLNKRRLLPQAIVRNIVVPFATLGPAVLLAFTPYKAYGLAVPYLFGNLLGFAIALWYFHRAFPRAVSEWSGSAKVPGDMVRFSAPLASTDFAMSLAYRVDILLLARFVGLEAVEVYSVIVMIANTLKSVRQSFDGIMLSVFSKAKSKVPTREQIRHFNYANWMVLSIQLPFIPLAALFGSELLGLISPQYAQGRDALVIALILGLWGTPGTFAAQLLLGMGRTMFTPLAQAAYFGSTVLFNILLIPRFGMTGAALATGAALFVSAAVTMVAVRIIHGKGTFMPAHWIGLGVSTLLLMPSLLLGLVDAVPLEFRIAAYVASLVAFSLWSRRLWRKLNRVDDPLGAKA